MRVKSALGQVGLGSSRPKSSWHGSTQPGHFGLVLYSLLFSINDASTILDGMCFIVQQKFEKIMFGPTLSLVCQSWMYYSTGLVTKI